MTQAQFDFHSLGPDCILNAVESMHTSRRTTETYALRNPRITQKELASRP